MSISSTEFRVAMETYGAKTIPNRKVARLCVLVPCFAIGDVEFLHSGSYYIVHRGGRVPKETMYRAMAEFGEKHPGGDNFCCGEIHSIKGILTLAAMLEDKYSKEFVDELTNTTYKKLLECSLIQTNAEISFKSNNSPKMEELRKKLAEYINIVNPFGNNTVDLKEPIEYIDLIHPSIIFEDEKTPYAQLALSIKSSYTKYINDSDGWHYESKINIKKDKKNGYIRILYDYKNGNNCNVYLRYKTIRGNYTPHPNDIDLQISLKTGLAWQTNKESQATPATDEQIDIMITHLNTSIKKIKQRIVRYMIKKA